MVNNCLDRKFVGTVCVYEAMDWHQYLHVRKAVDFSDIKLNSKCRPAQYVTPFKNDYFGLQIYNLLMKTK